MPAMMPPVAMPPQPPMAPAGNTAPAAMMTQNFGKRAQGLAIIAAVCKALENVIPMLGSGSDEGKDALGALKTLSKYAGGVSPDLSAQELKLMAAKAPAVPPSPMQGAQQRLASLSVGAPPAA